MVFTSSIFIFFFLPITILANFMLPVVARNLLLLLASLVFYVWGERTLFYIMLLSIALNWVFGLVLERVAEKRARKLIVALAVIANLGLLGFYKYSGFIVGVINSAVSDFGRDAIAFEAPNLPLGISFFTFHALSYVIDIYRRDATAQRNPVDFALYISFFPQLIAGPIIRYHDVYKQLSHRRATPEFAVLGVERLIAGLGKKAVLANPLGEVADGIFALPAASLSPSVAWLGIVAYTLQIYLDFSAYSDMAIGIARIFGFSFLENFNYPYTSRSIQEFWRRWHISLSNWFRDYLYIPLGGNKGPHWRVGLNLVTVFFLCGLWHGASWNFVVWGLLHGAYLVLERIGLGKLLDRAPNAVRHIYVLCAVTTAWVFFRAADLGGAVDYLGAMFGINAALATPAFVEQFLDARAAFSLVVGALASWALFTRVTTDWTCRATQSRGEFQCRIEDLRIGKEGRAVLAVRFMVLIAIAAVALSRIAAGTYNPFIYFRF